MSEKCRSTGYEKQVPMAAELSEACTILVSCHQAVIVLPYTKTHACTALRAIFHEKMGLTIPS